MMRDWIQKEVTSAEANKLLKSIENERKILVEKERKNSSFRVANVENVEDVRPNFNFMDNYSDIRDYDESIANLKHSINMFNTTTELNLKNGKMTIDKVLTILPLFNNDLRRLESLMQAEEKTRVGYGGNDNFIEYDYVNYDINEVKREYNELKSIIENMQLELDKVNSTIKFTVVY